MCLAVYVASPLRLSLIAWDERRPAFYVQEADNDDDVRSHFSHPNVYYLGAHEGCGCGFKYGVWPGQDENDRTQEEAGRTSVDSLRSYVADAAARAPLELYACWEDEQGLPEQERVSATPDTLGGERFEFVQRRMLVIVAEPRPR